MTHDSCEVIDLWARQLTRYAEKIKEQGELPAEVIALLELIKE